MYGIISKALSYFLIILTGYLLKTKIYIKEDASEVLSFIMLKITLPCSIVANMNGQSIKLTFLYIILLGIMYNVISLFIGYVSALNSESSIITMMNVSGYNIGCFAMPFVSGIFSPTAILATSMFDIGNSIMCLGFNYGIASALNEKKKYISFKNIFSKVIESIPIWTYIVMFVLCLINVKVPNFILPYFEVVGRANAFVAMLVVGVSMEVGFKKEELKIFFSCVSIRLIVSSILALISWSLPFNYEMRRVLIVLCFSPIGAASIVFTGKLGFNKQLAALINSLYIIISIVIMTTLIYIS